MNLLHPERLDALARAHALGTLSPRAARRFARVVAGSSVAAQAVADWQAVLGTLEEGAPASPEPRPRVWADVQRRLFEREAQALPQADRRGASRGAGGLALGWLRWPAGLVVGAAMLWTVLALRPQTFGLEPDAGAVPASYVGVLQDAQGRSLVATTARRHGTVLTVRLLRPVAVAPGHELVVWAWSDADPAPRRVARWTPAGPTVELPLPTPAETLLGPMTHLGLSLEAAGSDAAAPSQPLVAEGPCAKVW